MPHDPRDPHPLVSLRHPHRPPSHPECSEMMPRSFTEWVVALLLIACALYGLATVMDDLLVLMGRVA